jgi:thiosulfate dehydrogenase
VCRGLFSLAFFIRNDMIIEESFQGLGGGIFMNTMLRNVTLLCCVIIFATFLVYTPGYAGEIEKLTGMRFVQLAKGGLLYDNWPAELGIKIEKTHPSYPAEGRKKGALTWRCKECHGWDYKGKAGNYSSGSHYTGITGIRSYANINPIDIVRILKDDTHAFKGLLSDDDLDALALFVSYGQIDVDLYINRKTKKTLGDPSQGGRVYLATCVKCHGNDGKEISFSHEEKSEYIGTAANGNPWEALHKIRWGHTGTPMISLVFLELKEQLDVLAFCQALPEK